ncbi:MAG TPA: RHS repeat-associated core domain-containing protein [Thermoanaerobaculia bacterium]|nr:RHS repeat-associated core domain-containing protein [Thermoanaerobaculia bacterium]
MYIVAATTVFAWTNTAFARPEKLPPGMGKYVMVLWDAGTPVPGNSAGEKIKKVVEPDLSKMGGTVLHKRDNRRVITLPLAAVAQLRKHESVAYLQRLWSGEALEDWNESWSSGSSVQSEADIDVSWGPKSYTYDGAGNIKSFGADNFTYDAIGRLKEATVNGVTESYSYDSFGNMLSRTTGSSTTMIPVDSSSNRLAGPGYDAAGNVVAREGRLDYEYDSLNLMVRSRNGRRMIYDADDERIGTMLDGSTSRWTMRDFSGQIIREYKSEELGSEMYWTWNLDHVRGEGTLLAGESQQWGYLGTNAYGGKRHYHLDHLGSVRLVTDGNGRSLSEHTFYPFGVSQTKTYQEQINWADPHIDAMRFAGHWRDFQGWLDVENSDYLDYMHARYYDPNLGRFLSVDPKLPSVAQRHTPQRWNRYSYVMNNPLLYVDPNGQDLFIAFDFSQSDLSTKERGQIMQGVRQRFLNAGVKNVVVNDATSRDQWSENKKTDRAVTVEVVSRDIDPNSTDVVYGKAREGSREGLISTFHAKKGDTAALVNLVVNVTAHEIGHASGDLPKHRGDAAPNGSKAAPGSIMEQDVSVEELSERQRDFDYQDALSLQEGLNPPY